MLCRSGPNASTNASATETAAGSARVRLADSDNWAWYVRKVGILYSVASQRKG
jgi:hypothetical protein